jgi:energy-coupling factor transporter ATP-binding protein EcfA2
MFITIIFYFFPLNNIIETVELNNTNVNTGMFDSLFETIEDRKISMFKSESMKSIKPNSVILLGPTGSGKTTLVQYLNGEELINLYVDFAWIIEKKSSFIKGENSDIGQRTKSKTMIPTAYSPNGKNFSYMDNPGFFDNRGMMAEIANSYLMKYALSEVKSLKFLLLISVKDVHEKGLQLHDSIKSISNLLGLSEINKLKNIEDSIGLVITKVENEGKINSSVIRASLKQRLLEIINDTSLSDDVRSIFEKVVQNNQIEIFSNPRLNGSILANTEKIQIESMIENQLTYTKKEDIDVKVRISVKYMPDLRTYVYEQMINFEKFFQDRLNSSANEYFLREKNKDNDLNNFAQIYSNLRILSANGTKMNDFERFIYNISSSILNKTERKFLIEKKKVIDYFIDLIPDIHRIGIMNEKQWITVDLLSFLNVLQNKLIEVLRFRYKKNNEYVEKETLKGLEEYYPTRIKNLVFIEDLSRFEEELRMIIEKDEMDIQEYIESIPKFLLSTSQIEKIYEKNSKLISFIQLLPEEAKYEFPIKLKWTGVNLIKKLNNLIDELKKYRVQDFYYDTQDDSYIYRGHFLNISFVLSKIQTEHIIKMKRVLIYVTHSVIFDKNYSISGYKYKEDAPDLLIIAPNIISESPITVNLSCDTELGYPSESQKADNGNGYGVNGENGLPGLSGYNGGNLLIFSDKISEPSNLKFISKGIIFLKITF